MTPEESLRLNAGTGSPRNATPGLVKHTAEFIVNSATQAERERCAQILRKALAFEWSAEIAPDDEAAPHSYAAQVLGRVLREVEEG